MEYIYTVEPSILDPWGPERTESSIEVISLLGLKAKYVERIVTSHSSGVFTLGGPGLEGFYRTNNVPKNAPFPTQSPSACRVQTLVACLVEQ